MIINSSQGKQLQKIMIRFNPLCDEINDIPGFDMYKKAVKEFAFELQFEPEARSLEDIAGMLTEALGNAYASDVYVENEDDVTQEMWYYLKEQNI